MNYYERHIGDYLKDTAHLSLLEHGIYTRLLDVYYTRESAIPDDQVARLIGARSKDEKDALQAVLVEFFVKTDAGWSQDRCDREIARYLDKQTKAKNSANARWGAKPSQSDGNAKASANGMRTHSDGNAPSNQTPDTSPKGIPGAIAPLPPAQPAATPPSLNLTSDPGVPSIQPCPVQQLVGLFVARCCPELPKPRYEMWKDSKGADAMRQRWKWLLSADAKREDDSRYATTAAEAIEWFGLFFDKVHESDFLSGRNGTWKNCDLTWLMNRENFMKVVQGNYANERETA